MVLKIKNNVLWEYTGFDSVIVIPDNLIEIASNVFRSRDEITEVIIPEGVARIWDYRFAPLFAGVSRGLDESPKVA